MLRFCKIRSAAIQSLESRCLLSASLVKDINTKPGGSITPSQLVSVGNVVYFTHTDGVHGYEPWRTDGTAAGTYMLKDINPGRNFSWAAGYVAVGSTVYFGAEDGVHGGELWKTDGTEAGTVMVKDINPGTAAGAYGPFASDGSSLFLFANDGVNGTEMWTSNGTAAGTKMVADLRPGSTGQTNSAFVVRAGIAYFRASNGSTTSLYRSDGTAAGTTVVRTAAGSNGDPLSVVHLTVSGSRVYFSDNLSYLWATDGTPAGTIKIDSTNASMKEIVAVGSTLYYTRSQGLYRVAAGATAASLVASTSGIGTTYNSVSNLTNVNGTLFLDATPNSTYDTELYRVASATSSIALYADVTHGASSQPADFTYVNGDMYFTAYDDSSVLRLKKINLTTGSGSLTDLGTVVPIRSGSTLSPNPTNFVAAGTTLVYFNQEGTYGVEPWYSEGTLATTGLLRDISPATMASGPFVLGNAGSKTIIVASTATTGGEPFVTDGTAAGTQLLADLNPGTAWSGPSGVGSLGSQLLFTAFTPASGDELYITDGTPAGTKFVKDINPGTADTDIFGFETLNGIGYFAAKTAATGYELWRTDGTAAGTSLVTELAAGTGDGLDYPFGIPGVAAKRFGNRLFFSSGASASGGSELWSTDGTAGGTSRLIDIAPGTASSTPGDFVELGGFLYFSATDGTTGKELWRTDGTAPGTARVLDLRAGSAGSNPDLLLVDGPTLYFTANDGTHGIELWKTDGTAAGTAIVSDLAAGSESTTIRQIVGFKGKLYFGADVGATDAMGLYATDGTAAGTSLVKALPGAFYGVYSNTLRVSGGEIVFAADDVDHGLEPWTSDGTAAGTNMLLDVAPGTLNGALSPFWILPNGKGALFDGNDFVSDSELWIISDDVAPVLFAPKYAFETAPEVTIGVTEDISGTLAASDVALKNLTTNTTIAASDLRVTYTADGKIHVRYAGSSTGALPDGSYRLTLAAGQLADSSGNALQSTLTFDFFVLVGDANRSHTVDFDDLVILAQNYGLTGKTFSQGDFTYDGKVDFDDLVILAQKYNSGLAQLASLMTPKDNLKPATKPRRPASVGELSL